jgi:hypothetical protein
MHDPTNQEIKRLTRGTRPKNNGLKLNSHRNARPLRICMSLSARRLMQVDFAPECFSADRAMNPSIVMGGVE